MPFKIEYLFWSFIISSACSFGNLLILSDFAFLNETNNFLTGWFTVGFSAAILSRRSKEFSKVWKLKLFPAWYCPFNCSNTIFASSKLFKTLSPVLLLIFWACLICPSSDWILSSKVLFTLGIPGLAVLGIVTFILVVFSDNILLILFASA